MSLAKTLVSRFCDELQQNICKIPQKFSVLTIFYYKQQTSVTDLDT